MITRDNNSIISGDFAFTIFENMTSLQFKTMLKVSKTQRDLVIAYIDALLQPYSYDNYELSPYCNSSPHYDATKQIPSFEYAKRALTLAVTFYPYTIECILNMHPEILSSVLETRTVTITDPLTEKSFTADWHFKLSHLLASQGRGYDCLFSYFMDKYKATNTHLNELGLFFSEPICWQSETLKGSKGPTAPFISVLYQQDKFFNHIAGSDCALMLDKGFDEPYNKINFCYIALQQASESMPSFYTLLHQYAYTPMVQECVDIIISAALKGNHSPINFLFNAPSDRVASLLSTGLFMAIEANNMDVVKSISRKIENFQYLFDKQVNTPLSLAISMALKNDQYLPMVKHFLCCGCETSKYIKKLLEETFMISMSSMFAKEDSIAKQIRHYVKTAECFRNFVILCRTSYTFRFGSSPKMKDREKILLKVANMDKAFFNELVVSLLDNDDERMLNKTLNDFDNRKHYFLFLYNFIKNDQGAAYLTSDTLERIADSLMVYRKSRDRLLPNDRDVWCQMACIFYQKAMSQAKSGSDCYERVKQKLSKIDGHEEFGLEYLTSTKQSKK